METQQPKIGLAILITAIIVGGGVYYFTGTKDSKTISFEQGNTVFDQSSKDYAVMGRQFWSAFQCASWASINDDIEEQNRLFLFGYERAQKFVAAVRAEKIEQEDISQEVPIVILLNLSGPTEEFVIGKLFESSQEQALEDVFKTGDEFNSDGMQKIIAGNKFQDGNCQVIGK